ncbi:UNVERIFIED_CONTAM: hypothetical protein FKN15_067343, partial [Acipenser sinensis]
LTLSFFLFLAKHAVNGNTMVEPFPEGMEKVIFGMGCFWGAERRFWRKSGVFSTQVGYAGGYTPNPNYKEVCSGRVHFCVSLKERGHPFTNVTGRV